MTKFLTAKQTMVATVDRMIAVKKLRINKLKQKDFDAKDTEEITGLKKEIVSLENFKGEYT